MYSAVGLVRISLHPVSGTGIQTRNLLIISRLPKPLDQGSHPKPVSVGSLILPMKLSAEDVQMSIKHIWDVKPWRENSIVQRQFKPMMP